MVFQANDLDGDLYANVGPSAATETEPAYQEVLQRAPPQRGQQFLEPEHLYQNTVTPDTLYQDYR